VVLGALSSLVLGAFFLRQRRLARRLAAALAAQRASEAQAIDLLRLSTGYVFLHDLDGRLSLVNPAAAHALGGTPDSLVGRRVADFMVDAPTAWPAYAARIEARGLAEGIVRVRTVDGERHWRVSSLRSSPREARAYVVGNAIDVTDQVQQADVLREQSERDALTGCWNRRRLDVFEAMHLRDGWAVVAIDLDHFKDINDSEGHDGGDRVLVAIANFLHERVRSVDALLRVGGDEFALLLPGADAGHVEQLAARLREDVNHAPCGYTIGTAVREVDETLADTLARADAAMYATRSLARATGRLSEAS
jgi:diguanylate cyclase (GGDEF)-like protein/PAS domain S-box-containing protein